MGGMRPEDNVEEEGVFEVDDIADCTAGELMPKISFEFNAVGCDDADAVAIADADELFFSNLSCAATFLANSSISLSASRISSGEASDFKRWIRRRSVSGSNDKSLSSVHLIRSG